MRLQHRAARGHFNRGDATSEQDNESPVVSGAEHAGLLGERRDDMICDLFFSDAFRTLERHVDAFAADESYPQLYRCHLSNLYRARAGNVAVGPGNRLWGVTT